MTNGWGRSRAAVLIGVGVLPFLGCDAATLPTSLQLLVTGSIGQVDFVVDPPHEVVLEDGTHEFQYHIAAKDGFRGTIDLSLAGLVPEVELVKDLDFRREDVREGRFIDGSFVVRALGPRDRPVDLELRLTSRADGATDVVVYPPAILRLILRPSLRVACFADPEVGTAPLDVSFRAQRENCVGPCRFGWDFGDGATADMKDVSHRYQDPGTYLATVTLADDRERSTCTRTIRVAAAERPGAPAPIPAGNRPPNVVDFALRPGPGPLSRNVRALIVDPDPGDTVSWQLACSTFVAFNPPAGTTDVLASVLVGPAAGSYSCTVTARDGRGAENTVPFTVVLP